MDKIDIHTFEESANVTHFMNKFSLIRSIRDMHDFTQENREFLIDGFIVSLVTDGEIQITINEDIIHCIKGDILICTPRTIIEKGMFNMNFDAFGLLFASKYAENVAIRLNFDWMQRVISVEHDIIHVTEEEATILQDYFNLINKSINSPGNEKKENKINSLIDSLVYTLLDIGSNTGKLTVRKASTPQEYIFQRFGYLLTPENITQHHFKRKQVQEYASELNITPKYFSQICKELTGKSARKIIDEEIIKSAKIMLRDNKYSIKQISCALDFKNSSHFGTFFSKHVGMSPQAFRKKAAD